MEREAFESPPVFNSVQRKQYFDFPTELRCLAAELRAPTHQLGFFLLSGANFQSSKKLFPAERAANLAFLDSSDYVPGVQTPKRRLAKREHSVLNLDRCRKFVELLEHPLRGISPLVRTRQPPVHRGRHPVIHPNAMQRRPRAF